MPNTPVTTLGPRSMADGIPPPAEVGSILAGKYRVGEVIASGGMGVVMSGEHIGLMQRVAIKFLRTWTPDGVARFEREARACARMTNEHIVRVIDVDVLPSRMPFMVMELLDGKDLSVLLKERGRLPLEVAVDYVLQACEALAEAHKNGIVHRDLKPANLFLTERADGSPLVKVLDFGISKMRDEGNPNDELTTTNSLMGSPSYMSPEQLRAARHADARSDIWALGAVLYKLIVGHNPFLAESTPDLCIKILTEDILPIDEVEVPEGLLSTIRRCLEKDREKRYQDIGELAVALQPWSTGTGVARVVRTLGTPTKREREQRTKPAVEPTRVDVRQATTVDPSVSDTSRTGPTWRLPAVVLGLVAALGSVGWFAFARLGTSAATTRVATTVPMEHVSATVTSSTASTTENTTSQVPASPVSANSATNPTHATVGTNPALGSHARTGSTHGPPNTNPNVQLIATAFPTSNGAPSSNVPSEFQGFGGRR